MIRFISILLIISIGLAFGADSSRPKAEQAEAVKAKDAVLQEKAAEAEETVVQEKPVSVMLKLPYKSVNVNFDEPTLKAIKERIGVAMRSSLKLLVNEIEAIHAKLSSSLTLRSSFKQLRNEAKVNADVLKSFTSLIERAKLK